MDEPRTETERTSFIKARFEARYHEYPLMVAFSSIPRHIIIADAPLGSATGVGSTIQRMWNDPWRLTLYRDASADTTVRVREPTAEGPSGCMILDDAFTSYVQESP